ncbi:MAG: [FeFe] hydrogenase H-cluster radical SAM maturase HydE [Candidatus Omnitrophica bacterium]|nr:[FeFe] hydrogenase H-cluster radical SAM maturase HydE [Candidatus Omnitrophota bacterium]
MTKREIIECLRGRGKACLAPTDDLFAAADAARKKYCGDEVHIRGVIEFSNYCRRDCLYCGLRRSNAKLKRYRMSPDEIVRVAAGAGSVPTVVLQSGEDEHYTIRDLDRIITRIKKQTGAAITLSIGERPALEYKALRQAGADRYLLKFETSDKELFKRLKPDSSYEERMRCLEDLRKTGYQVGSGTMVGLPGQSDGILAGDILLMKKLDLDMIGIGPFIPHPDTPLKNMGVGVRHAVHLRDKGLRVIALARIVTRNAHIPATTALGTIDPNGRQKGLRCGANVIMPNLTPQKYRKLYAIYPDKICINENFSDCRGCVERLIRSLGRTIATGRGNSLKSL